MSLVEASLKAFISSSEISIGFSYSIYYWNRRSDKKYHQRHSNNHQVIKSKFSVDDWFGIFREEKFGSGCGINQLRYVSYSIRLSKDKLLNLEHHFSTGWLLYTKRTIFGVSGSFSFDFNLKSFESYPCGDQIKSNKFIIEHP
jgi:hypothetical protein